MKANSALAVPTSHQDLLTGATVAMSTSNADGSIQTTAIWVHLGEDGAVRTSLAQARHKYRNLQARPRATLFSVSPSNPFHTIEIRATVTFAEDPDRSFFAELLAAYGQTLETFSAQAAEDRVIVTFHPTRIRA